MNKNAMFVRRDFFKGACVAGFMVATAKLPAVAGGKFEGGKRGGAEEAPWCARLLSLRQVGFLVNKKGAWG